MPVTCAPVWQAKKSPRRQLSQERQCQACQPTPTRWPACHRPGTSLPTASITPTTSCPGTRGKVMPGQWPSLEPIAELNHFRGGLARRQLVNDEDPQEVFIMAKPILPDDLWRRLEPFIPKPRENRHVRYAGRKPTEPRRILTGILFVLRTGVPWLHL